MSSEKFSERKIHITLSDAVHQRLRVKCALQDTTIQNYVSQLIIHDVSDVVLPADKSNNQETITATANKETKPSKGSQKTKLPQAG